MSSAVTTMSQKSQKPALGAGWQVISWRAWSHIGLLLLAFVGLFYEWFYRQSLLSADKMEDWGHAFIVPLISLYMLWQNRAAVLSTPVRVFWPGLLPLMLGIICYFFFVVSPAVSNHMLQGFAMLLTLAGAALLITGPAMFRHLFLPIAFLIFGVTISEQIMTKATFPLQLLASKGAGFILQTIAAATGSFMVEVKGNTLELIYNGKTIPMNVAEACSGMRMVVAFVALAAAVAIFSCKHWWQRIALLALAVPVALLMNVLRVAVLGLASLANPSFASGSAHMLIGTLLLIPGMFLFLGVVGILNRVVVDDPRRPA